MQGVLSGPEEQHAPSAKDVTLQHLVPETLSSIRFFDYSQEMSNGPELPPRFWCFDGFLFGRSAGVCPVDGLGDRLVEVSDESFEFGNQILFGGEAAAPHHATIDHSEDGLNLIEP